MPLHAGRSAFPNPYPVTFTSFTESGITSSDNTACPASNVTVNDGGAISLLNAANSVAVPGTITNVVTMARGNDGECRLVAWLAWTRCRIVRCRPAHQRRVITVSGRGTADALHSGSIDGLYPGFTGQMTVRVSNPFNHSIRLTTVTATAEPVAAGLNGT